MTSQVILVIVTLFGYVYATNYERGYGGVGEKAVGRRRAGDASGRYETRSNYPRKLHRLEYTVEDGQGNTHFRYEYGDEFGALRGRYGYTNARGLYRVVEYVADAGGFRANIKTNEPGAANVKTFPEKPASAHGTGEGQVSTDKVTGAVRSYACDTGPNFNRRECLQGIGLDWGPSWKWKC